MRHPEVENTKKSSVWLGLEPLDTQAVLSRLSAMPADAVVHSFSGFGLFGCDMGRDNVMARIQEHGARKASDDFRGRGLGHSVVTIDRSGYLICLEIDLLGLQSAPNYSPAP